MAPRRQRICDVACRHRPIELPGFAGLADNDDAHAIDTGRDLGGLLAALLVALLYVLAFGLEALAVGFGGAERLALGQKEVTGVAVAHVDFVADMAVATHALEQNDFHLLFS